jgi:hypothetical protein
MPSQLSWVHRQHRNVSVDTLSWASEGACHQYLYVCPGSTETSLWTHYKAGTREYCGNAFPDGLRKNDRFPSQPSHSHIVVAALQSNCSLQNDLKDSGCHSLLSTDRLLFDSANSESVGAHRLAANVITPTTKSEHHDVPISPGEIVARGLMSQQDWDKVIPYTLTPSSWPCPSLRSWDDCPEAEVL